MKVFCQPHNMSSSSFILHTSSFGFYDLRSRTKPREALLIARPRSPLAATRSPTIKDTVTADSAMTRIDLTGQHLTALPELPGLASARELFLDDNALTGIPPSIPALATLERLHLRANRLRTLPDTIGLLTSLTDLRLGANGLTSVP